MPYQKTHHISSLHNPRIRFLYQLKEKSKIRKREGLFLIEGKREISLAIKGNFMIQSVYFCQDIISLEEVQQLFSQTTNSVEFTEVTSDIYKKLAYREKTEGVVAVAEYKKTEVTSISLNRKNPLILVAEAPEKPGNIGALLRTADAAGVDAILIADLKTDLYNPNIIRSSVGCVFTNTLGTGSSTEIINYLQDQKVTIYGASLQTSIPYHTADFKGPTAIVVGTEDKGLTDIWLKNTVQNIKIPMNGVIDSMNVSVAAGILIYEAVRQRHRYSHNSINC